MKSHTFVKLSLAEYVVVSLCLALVIARLFPAVHNHIVSKATRLEHQSLYWGTVVVSNTFVYGLVFAAGKGWSILQSCAFLESMVYHDFVSNFLSSAAKQKIIPVSLEVVINIVLFSSPLFASLKSRNSSSAIVPRELGKFFINLSFCWSCFCVCVCRCRAKTMSVLIMFSLMVFLHHNIMEAISLGFVLFIEPTRILVITIDGVSCVVCFSLDFHSSWKKHSHTTLSTVYQSCWNSYSTFYYFWCTWAYGC